MVVRRRVFVVVAAGLMLLTVAVAPAAAAKPGTEGFSFSESGLSADAFVGGDCVDNLDGTVTCSGESVFAFEGLRREKGQGAAHANEVCYASFTETFDPDGGEGGSFSQEFGCAVGGIVWGRDLASATISPTTVTLEGESCTVTGPDTEVVCAPTSTREVVVEGTFTGTGSLVRQSHRGFSDDGHCVFRDSSSGYSRSATFEGTVDGDSFVTEEAFLNDGKFSVSETCSIE
jgi:hypothetical protein